jgi:hypothetical protein
MKREVRVVRTATGVVDRVLDVTGKSDEMVKLVMIGLLRNVDRDTFHAEDSADDK